MVENKTQVYVLANSKNFITRCEGGYTMDNIDDINLWTMIDEGYGDKYNLCQSNYFEKSLITEGGAYRYKLVDGKPMECSAEEIAEQEESQRPVPRAPRNIVAGEYVTIGGVLYLARENIPNGEPIIVDQNAVETTIEEQLAELAGGE